MNISMDKYKTATLGKALKSVYRGEIQISDSVELAKKENKTDKSKQLVDRKKVKYNVVLNSQNNITKKDLYVAYITFTNINLY